VSCVRRIAAALMVGYLLMVAGIVFWPSADPASASVAWMSDGLGSLGAPNWVSGGIVEFLANVAMFLPLSVLGSLLAPAWRWKQWVAFGFCISVAIELGQLAMLPGRFASGVDVLANTLGALLGATLGFPLRDRVLRDRAAFRYR